jgi:hypothetical protein
MRSKVAEQLRREQMEEVAALSIDARIERLAPILDLGLEAFMAAEGIDRQTAIRRIRRERQSGRRYSRCMIESLK